MSANYYHRNSCRLCESTSVDLILNLTACPPVDSYLKASELIEDQECFPIDLYLCQNCGHAQLLDVVSPKLLFGNYIYTTASSPGLVSYFEGLANTLVSKLALKAGALAVDIGSNDGTLLSFLKKNGLSVLGVDPAKEIALAATERGIETIPDFFGPEIAAQIVEDKGKAGLVTANNVFAHADNLGNMADGVKVLLAADGVFAFEVSYLRDMLDGMVFDYVYHEHLSNHSVKPLKTFLKKHGLHLIDVEHTPSKGGTIRCYAQLDGGPRAEAASVESFIKSEEDAKLYSLDTYKEFTARIDALRDQVKAQLDEIKSQGKSIAGYGAAATATVLMYHFGLAKYIDFIIDDNPERQGRYSPGDHIPVVSSAALSEKKPDYVLILVWRFADMIIERNKDYIAAGGQFIIPVPELKVIGA